MAAVGLYALTGVLVVLATFTRLHVAATTVILSLLLVPSQVLLPFEGTSAPLATRVVFVAFVVTLGRRVRSGEVDPASLRPPRLVVAVVLGFLVIGVVGITFADPDIGFRLGFERWLIFLDKAALLWIGVVLARNLGPRRVADLIIVGLGLSLLVSAGEYLGGQSWSSVFPVTDAQSQRLLAPLEERGGARVRAAALFALENAWVIAVLLPLAVERLTGSVSRRWRLGLVAVVAASGFVLPWTRSRSGLVAAAVAIVLLLLGTRFRRHLLRPAVVAAMIAGVVVLSTGVVEDVYEIERPPEATEQDVRFDRMPGVLELAAEEPYTGLGLGGVTEADYVAIDNGWLLLYADTGVIGAATYASLVGLALVTVAGALRGPPSGGRQLAAAVFAGMTVWVAANATYGAFNLRLSGGVFWLLAGLGVVLAERRGTPVWSPRPAVAVAAGGAAVLVALAAAVATPTHVARTYQFQHLSTPFIADTEINSMRLGFITEETACQALGAVAGAQSAVDLDCVRPGAYYPSVGGRYRRFTPASGRLRIEAASAEQLDAFEEQMQALDDQLAHFELRRTSPDREGVPTAARTAPVWTAVAVAFLLAFWPRRARRPVSPRPEPTRAEPIRPEGARQ